MVEGADENGDVSAKLAEFLILVGNRFFKFGGGGAEADFKLRSGLTGLIQFPVRSTRPGLWLYRTRNTAAPAPAPEPPD